ncbi:MAG: hypothetical protein ACLP4V_24000 [Methylocella sp.]
MGWRAHKEAALMELTSMWFVKHETPTVCRIGKIVGKVAAEVYLAEFEAIGGGSPLELFSLGEMLETRNGMTVKAFQFFNSKEEMETFVRWLTEMPKREGGATVTALADRRAELMA